jgi:hypothetical protein
MCDEDRSNRRQKFAWYGVTAVAVIAIVLLNSDRKIVTNNVSELEGLNQEVDTVQSSSIGRLNPLQPKPIEWISVLGERNSGTRWLYEYVI